MIAKLGGFLGRKGDGEPGVKTLWLVSIHPPINSGLQEPVMARGHL